MRTSKLPAFVLALGLTLAMFQVIPSPCLAGTGSAAAKRTAVQPSDNAKDAQTFEGRIAQTDDGKYVLVEDGTKIRYVLDDQAKAKQFDGRNVKVTGTCDVASQTIRVQAIQGA